MRKERIAVTALLTSARATAEDTAREAAAHSAQLQGVAATVEDLIDRLEPCVGGTVADVYAPLFRA